MNLLGAKKAGFLPAKRIAPHGGLLNVASVMPDMGIVLILKHSIFTFVT